MLRHVSALAVGHLQRAPKFFISMFNLCFNVYGRNSTYSMIKVDIANIKYHNS